jgi:signal transduction histidine kinase
MATWSRLSQRIRRLPRWAGDSLLALLLAVPTSTAAFADPGEGLREPAWLVLPLLALSVLPLAARRYRPLSVFGVTLGAALVLELLEGTFQAQASIVALYTIAAHSGRRAAKWAAVATVAAIAVMLLNGPRSELIAGVAVLAIYAAAWALGDNVRTRRAYLRGLEEKAERLERERIENVRRATAEEQARISRELHDVLAHSVSVMVVQAAAAGDVFDANPARAREALASVEATGRAALAELRRLLGNVRHGDVAYAPQPGLAALDALAEHVRAAGVDVEVQVEGASAPLAAGLDLAAYRIVQEALTNTLKHAGATRATVTVRHRDARVEVEVVDDGVGVTRGDGTGHGIIGMRERASLYGGELRAEPRLEGGFRVFATLPLDEEGT